MPKRSQRVLNMLNTGIVFIFKKMQPYATINNVTGAAIVGNTAYIYLYRDGATIIPYVYFIINSSTLQERQMVI